MARIPIRRWQVVGWSFAALVAASLCALVVLLWPVSVHAQAMYHIVPITCTDRVAPDIEGARIHDLSADQASAYITAGARELGRFQFLDEGVAGRLVEHPSGGAMLIFIVDGMVCSHVTVGPSAHQAGWEAAFGEPT